MITPDFIGQVYKDTLTGNIWRANSLTPGDWTLEVQNMQVKWTPNSLLLSSLQTFYNVQGELSGITSIIFSDITSVGGFDIEQQSDLVSVHFPNLVSIDLTNEVGGYLQISDCDNFTTLVAPALSYIKGGLFVTTLSLTSLSFPSLVTVDNSIDCSGASSLSSVSFPALLPANTRDINFAQCALSQASVDHILARCVANASYVSGVVDLTGGTNAAPSSIGGGSDYAVLIARGVVVTVNP